MARWNEEHERSMTGRGRSGEEQRGGEWQGGRREWEDRDRERETSAGDDWRAGGRRYDRYGDPERWSWDEDERGREHGPYGREEMRRMDWGRGRGEWNRDRDERGGYEREHLGPRGLRALGERWRGEPGSAGRGGPSYGAGGMYGGAGGAYSGSMSEGIGGRRFGGGYGMGEYGGHIGDDWERGADRRGGGWRDTSRDFARDLRRHGEEEGPLDRLGERMKEGWRRITGRGPRGYKRSDERIREEVAERLARSGVNAEEVEIRVEKGEVTLTGFVERREDKRWIEDIADDVFGVDEVINNVRVHRGERQPLTAGQAHTGTGTQTGATQTAGTQRASQPTQTQPGRH